MRCKTCGTTLSPLEIASKRGECEWCKFKTKNAEKQVSWWEQEDKPIKHKSAAAMFIR